MKHPFDTLLDRYANLIVRTGLNIAPGQQLVISAPLEAVPLVRLVTEHAYLAGATLVTPLYADDEATLARYRAASAESFDVAANWMFNGMAEAFKGGAARLAIVGEDPGLLSGQDTDKVSRANKARSTAAKPAMDLITSAAINWCVVSCSTPGWAKTVFPALPQAEAVEKLWQAIFSCTRADHADPVSAWAQHSARLAERTAYLNQCNFSALAYKSAGTDLVIGLAEGHVWKGGVTKAQNGVTYNANIPSEEVFTMPHKDRVDGVVTSTKPLSYGGTMIDGIKVRFEKGVIVESSAAQGAEAFARMISTDEGARRLGEVALVPHSSPISASGIVFNNTLFDENAASHVAVGQSYAMTMRESEKVSSEEKATRGANASMIHVDWMIGSDDMAIDAITQDGAREPLMRKGEWVD